MGRQRRRHPALESIDEHALAEFRAGLRRRYTDEEILDELRASARRMGRSPTMREFAADPEASVRPQTVIEHFGTWNAAKRAAGLRPRRFISREELVAQLRELGEELGRTPTVRDIEEHRGRMASKSLIWHTFGSLAAALKEAGFDVPVGEERLERAIADGAVLARELGHLPKMAEWKDAVGATKRCCPSGRSTGWSTCSPVRGLRSSSSSASACARRVCASVRTGRCLPTSGRGDERGEALEAEVPLVRRAHRRQLALFAIAPIRRPATLVHERTVDERHQPAFLDLGLAERRSERTLHDLERRTGGGEQDLVPPAGHPQGTADAASHVKGTRAAARRSRRRPWCPRAPRGRPGSSAMLDEREDHLRVHRHPGLVPHEIVTAEAARRRWR